MTTDQRGSGPWPPSPDGRNESTDRHGFRDPGGQGVGAQHSSGQHPYDRFAPPPQPPPYGPQEAVHPPPDSHGAPVSPAQSSGHVTQPLPVDQFRPAAAPPPDQGFAAPDGSAPRGYTAPAEHRAAPSYQPVGMFGPDQNGQEQYQDQYGQDQYDRDRYGQDNGGGLPARSGRRVSLVVTVLLVVVALLAGVLIGGTGYQLLFAADEPGERSAADGSVSEIADSALPSTVYIQATSGDSQATSGTGLVLREDGYIVTNNHVIDIAVANGEIVVGFPDGSEFDARVIGRTTDYDLAVLRVDREGLEPLDLADSDDVVVGDPVVAVGAPLGLEGTVTTGIISALNRPVAAPSGDDTTFINALQTDAAINPGNSGGPLLNDDGDVIGINTAIAQAASGGGGGGGSIGLGFAIPANQVRRTTDQIIETGRATYPIIGVTLDSRYDGEGVQIMDEDTDGNPAVTPDGPADQAGIEPGEVIVSIDGRPVTDPDEFIVAIRALAPGDEIVLGVRRDGGVEDVTVVLGEETSN